MKTSNLLLLALLGFIFLSMIGANLSLKSEFDKIDRNSPYAGYSHDTVPSFRYIKLTGQPVGLVQIQPGSTFGIRNISHDVFNQKFTVEWKMNGDTLVVNQQLEDDGRQIPFQLHQAFAGKPYVYIMAPAISGVHSEGVITKVHGWPNGEVTLVQEGRAMLLSDNQFEKVDLLVASEAHVELDATNHLSSISSYVKDSSRLVVEQPGFDSFRTQVDSTSHIDLPGNLLKKMLQL